jgi:hypothetical protein
VAMQLQVTCAHVCSLATCALQVVMYAAVCRSSGAVVNTHSNCIQADPLLCLQDRSLAIESSFYVTRSAVAVCFRHLFS